MAKILIVEDDPFLLKMYHKKLEVEGFEVDIAKDGQEGVSKIKSGKPDLVLMDIMMPKLNGLEAIDQVKADPNTKNIPVIVLTNLSTTHDAEEALKKGAAEYLVKSNHTPSQVVARVKAHLK